MALFPCPVCAHPFLRINDTCACGHTAADVAHTFHEAWYIVLQQLAVAEAPMSRTELKVQARYVNYTELTRALVDAGLIAEVNGGVPYRYTITPDGLAALAAAQIATT
jgi:hypothetical protein